MLRNFKATNGDIEKDIFVFQNELPSRGSSFIYSHDIQSIKEPETKEHESFQHWGGGIDLSDSDRPSYHDRIWTFWRETGQDLKSIRWGRFWKRFWIQVFSLTCIAMLMWAIVMLSYPQFRFNSACSPDGTFSIPTDIRVYSYSVVYKWWEQSSLFAIDYAFGDMDFATAKGVDILWDVGFGRGMQGLMAVISYTVCTKALSRLMERTPVTLRTFEAVTLQSDTIPALCKLGQEMLCWQSLRTWLIISWIAASTVMLLAFQTLSSAMTGYTTKVSGFVQTTSGERVPADLFEAVQYVIHDGSRLGNSFYDDYPVVMPRAGVPNIYAYEMGYYNLSSNIQNETNPVQYYLENQCNTLAPTRRQPPYYGPAVFGWVPFSGVIDNTTYTSCQLMWHVSEYTSIHGFLGSNNSNSSFNNSGNVINLPAPALNISAHFLGDNRIPQNAPWSAIPYGYWWNDSTGARPFQKTNLLWGYSKTMMNITQLNKLGTCQQADVGNIRYQWGFSTLLLLIFCGIMLIWSVGTYSMWMDSYFNSALDINKRNIGLKRAVLDINTAMARDLDSISTDAMGNACLKKIVKNNRLDYADLADHTITRAARLAAWRRNFDVKKWFREEMVWLILLTLFAMMIPISAYTLSTIWWPVSLSPLPLIGVILVLIIGRAHRSRWIWFVFFFLAFWAGTATFLINARHGRYRWQ